MCHLFNILVCPVAEYGSAMWWFMQAEEMARVHCEIYRGVLKTSANLACLIQRKVSMVKPISECRLHSYDQVLTL